MESSNAARSTRVILSLRDRLRLIFVFFVVVPLNAVWSIGCSILAACRKPVRMRDAVKNAIIRTILTRVEPRFLQYLMKPSLATYKSYMDRRGENFHVSSRGKARIMWLDGDSKADKVVYFFHGLGLRFPLTNSASDGSLGGGYVMPLSRGHIDWMRWLKEDARNAGVDISVAILEYCKATDISRVDVC